MREKMDAIKLAELENLANSIGNISIACRQMGVSRSFYYKWKKRHRTLDDTTNSTARRHPQAVPELLKKFILDFALEFSDWGSDRISYYLKLEKQYVSPTTVQKILNKNGLGRKHQRKSSRLPKNQD